MARENKISKPALPGNVLDIPDEGDKRKILDLCASLKEPARSKCIQQYSRTHREEWNKKQKEKIEVIKKGVIS